jgi:hypothetical protein
MPNLTLVALPTRPRTPAELRVYAATLVALRKEPLSDWRQEQESAIVMLVPPVQRGALWAAIRTLDQG